MSYLAHTRQLWAMLFNQVTQQGLISPTNPHMEEELKENKRTEILTFLRKNFLGEIQSI
jgi:hypothetical protein